jgi:hypothetical protein
LAAAKRSASCFESVDIGGPHAAKRTLNTANTAQKCGGRVKTNASDYADLGKIS